MANIKQPRSLQEAIAYFADPERAFVYAVNLRWPDRKITCPRWGHDQHSFLRTRLMWWCKGCKKQFSVKVGTIFEDSPLGMDKWMTAFWMVVNCKNGVSSAEMARTLKITQKSAWFMLHRVREVMQEQFRDKARQCWRSRRKRRDFHRAESPQDAQRSQRQAGRYSQSTQAWRHVSRQDCRHGIAGPGRTRDSL